MPPKTVTCNICNKEVMKSTTLAYKDGRACREHEGVEENSKLLQQKQKEDLNRSINKRYSKDKPKEYVSLEKRMNVCWKCGCEGTPLQEYYFQCSVAIEKMRITGANFNFFEFPQQIKSFLPKDCKVPLIIMSIENRKDILKKFRFKNEAMVQFSNMIQVCPTCLKVLGLEKQFEEDTKRRNVKLDFNTAFILGTLLQPDLEKIAIDQLYEESLESQVKSSKGE